MRRPGGALLPRTLATVVTPQLQKFPGASGSVSSGCRDHITALTLAPWEAALPTVKAAGLGCIPSSWPCATAHRLPPHLVLSPQVSRSACLMTTQLICKLLRSREAAAAVDVRAWPPILDTGQSANHPDTRACVSALPLAQTC